MQDGIAWQRRTLAMPIGERDSAMAEKISSSLGGGGGALVGDGGRGGSGGGTYAPGMSSRCGKVSVGEVMSVELFQCRTHALVHCFLAGRRLPMSSSCASAVKAGECRTTSSETARGQWGMATMGGGVVGVVLGIRGSREMDRPWHPPSLRFSFPPGQTQFDIGRFALGFDRHAALPVGKRVRRLHRNFCRLSLAARGDEDVVVLMSARAIAREPSSR